MARDIGIRYELGSYSKLWNGKSILQVSEVSLQVETLAKALKFPRHVYCQALVNLEAMTGRNYERARKKKVSSEFRREHQGGCSYIGL